MAEVQWYYARDDQQFGPVSATQLKELAEAGDLLPDHLVWREGMDDWAAAARLKGLFAEVEPSSSSHLSPPLADTPDQSGLTAIPSRGLRPVRRLGFLPLVQLILWITCVLVVLTGALFLALSLHRGRGADEKTAAAAVASAFFIGSYVLARAGEKIGPLLRRPPTDK
jgi:hypothetical protein